MKRVVAIAFCLVFMLSAYSGVEYKYNETDKFTGKIKFKTKPLIVLKKIEPFPKTVHKDIGISVKCQDSINVICFEYVLWKGAKMLLNNVAGSSVTLLLEDGSSVSLPVIGNLPNLFEYTYEHEFYVDEVNTQILKNKKITDVRFNAQINGYDLNIPEEKREEIRNLIKLFPTTKNGSDSEKKEKKGNDGSSGTAKEI